MGTTEIAIPLPLDPILSGIHVYMQAVLVDAGAPQSLALTGGLDVILG